MLEQILRECKNWFVREIHSGEFTVTDGRLVLPFLQNGQYFRIVGSVFNDGLHNYPADDLTNETFTGAVWSLAVPLAVISLAEKVAGWEEKIGAQATGPFTSESFGGYSYSKATSKDGGSYTWKDAFESDLNRWRKL